MIQEATTPRTYAPQDQRVADRIAAARQLIETAGNDAVIAATLATCGYDAAALDAGLALQQAAQLPPTGPTPTFAASPAPSTSGPPTATRPSRRWMPGSASSPRLPGSTCAPAPI